MTIRLLHFSDAHIDMAASGRHDPVSGLPLRVLDFLRSLDEIIEAALTEKVDLVIFAGDAYKDRSPAPTYQREWGKRIIRLSKAGIRTLLLVGNHDLSPSLGKANAIQEFDTLDIPHVSVLAKPRFLGAEELGLPAQVIALPWVSRSGLIAATDVSTGDMGAVYTAIEERLGGMVQDWLEKADPKLPTILTAHASVQGAVYGFERMVMLGDDITLSGSLVRDPRLDYVALGHIHKAQDLNPNAHPPVIYPGSIERVDFGEAQDDKFFLMAEVEKGHTKVEWRKLEHIRPYIDRTVKLESQEDVTATLLAALPKNLKDAIVRLTVHYPREWDELIDEPALNRFAAEAFEFKLNKHPETGSRIRLKADQSVGSLTPQELLDQYWQSAHVDPAEQESLNELAEEILAENDEVQDG